MGEKQNFKSLSSGLPELIQEEASHRRFSQLSKLLIEEKYDELKAFFLEKPHLLDSMQLKAFKLYYKLVIKEKIEAKDISLTEIKDFLADALSKELTFIHHTLKKDVDFSELKEFLPRLDEELATEIKESPETISYTLNLLETKTDFNEENYKEKLSEIYNEISQLQNQVAESSKINKETCFKANCCDCCVYTPPLVSKLEFEYIKANHELEPFIKKAQENQVKHQVEYGKKLELINLDTQAKEEINPNDFAHRCPFLKDDNACAIHAHRPFACRYYGLSTLDGKTVQACNYYLEQFDPDQRTVLDSRLATTILAQANKKLCNDKQEVGTLTAWLSS